MFTGIVEEIGRVVSLNTVDDMLMWDGTVGNGVVLVISCQTVLEGAYLGCSIAVNGTCLTATELTDSTCTFGCAPETLRKTNLSSLTTGENVNLERSIQVDGRNSGHFVQGHVDTTGKIQKFTMEGDSLWVQIKVPAELMQYIVPKGFIAIDGTSLTVCQVNPTDNWFSIMLVEYTQKKITLPLKSVGDSVNIEVDVMGKYVGKSLQHIAARVARMEKQLEFAAWAAAVGCVVLTIALHQWR